MIKELVLLLSSVLLVHLAPALPVPEPESTTCDQVVVIVYQNTMHQLGKGEAWRQVLSLMIDESKKYAANLTDVSQLETKLKAMDDLLDEMSAEVGVKRPFKRVEIEEDTVVASRITRGRAPGKFRTGPKYKRFDVVKYNNIRRSLARRQQEIARTNALKACRTLRDCTGMRRTESTTSLLSSFSRKSSSRTDLKYSDNKGLALGSKVGISTLRKHPWIWPAVKVSLGLAGAGALTWGGVKLYHKIEEFIFGTETAPIDPALQNVLREITQLVLNSNLIYDQDLELEDNESRLERAISAFRFDVVNFALAGDDIAEDIKMMRDARQQVAVNGHVEGNVIPDNIWSEMKKDDRIEASWRPSVTGANARYAQENDTMEIIAPSATPYDCTFK
jgi:hypothetical protein